MTDIEQKEVFRQKAIDLINEYRQQGGLPPIDWLEITTPKVRAFIRSIQLHEKTKKELADCKQELSDFRQEVSDEIEDMLRTDGAVIRNYIGRFIIPKPKPDPLVDVVQNVGLWAYNPERNWAGEIRAALEARGLEIREKGQ